MEYCAIQALSWFIVQSRELAVASCERRIEYRTDEFRGMLDRVNENKKKVKTSKKTSD